MSLVTSEMTPADIAAVTNNNGNGNGMWGDQWSFWIIILFLFAFVGNGWGNNGGFGGGGAMPYVMATNTNNDVQRGFDQASIMGALGNIGTGQVNGFAGVQQALCNGFGQAEISANARQMADMQNMYALQAQLAQCCCDNRAATNDLKYVVATEACADRQAVTDALRDVIASNTANTQAILDKLCQQENEALKNENNNLRMQINLQNREASQNAQTAAILAGQAQRAAEVEQYVNPTPVPAYVVQNPNCCTTNYGGCGSNF